MVTKKDVETFLKNYVETAQKFEADFKGRVNGKKTKSGLAEILSWHAIDTMQKSLKGRTAKDLLDTLDDWELEKLGNFAVLQGLRQVQRIAGTRSTNVLDIAEQAAIGDFWANLAEFLGAIKYL